MNRLALTVSLVALSAVPALAQDFFESGAGGTFSLSNWNVDRYAPGGWTPGATDPLSGTALRLDISNADRRDLRPGAYNDDFYNTQGRQRSTTEAQGWEVGGSLFIPSSWLDAGNLRRSDLWTRDQNTDENDAIYPIVGFVNNDPADPFNPGAANFEPRFRAWDSTTGWIDLPLVSVLADQYNSFKIKDTGSSYQYYINGNLVQTLSGPQYSEAGAEGLQTVFIEAYNFGRADNAGSLPDSSYSVFWKDVYAVPAPGGAALLGLGGLLGARRRRR